MPERPDGPRPPKTTPKVPPAAVVADGATQQQVDEIHLEIRAQYEADLAELHNIIHSLRQELAEAAPPPVIRESDAAFRLHLANRVILGLYQALLFNIRKVRREGGVPVNAQLPKEELDYFRQLVKESRTSFAEE